MDVPDLVRQAVGDEELKAGVNLGDEDAIVFTGRRALVYRGEGLLSDEDVAAYDFDFERLAVSEGRRKTKFTMTYVDSEQSFTVPGNRTDDVLDNLIEGGLRVAGAIDGDEGVAGVFRFSEMTLVVTEGRVLKHIGEYTWDADYEAFPFEDLTRLAFEEGSVATQIVLSVGARSERIKAPNAEAGSVRKALQEAVFAYHDVGSLEELNRKIAVEPEEDEGGDATGGLGLDSGIDPLVSDEPAEADRSPEARASRRGQKGGTEDADRSASNDDADTSPDTGGRPAGGDATEETVAVPSAEGADTDVGEQLADLTRAVERQNELLHRQQRTIEKLIEELRKGR